MCILRRVLLRLVLRAEGGNRRGGRVGGSELRRVISIDLHLSHHRIELALQLRLILDRAHGSHDELALLALLTGEN